MAKVYIVTGHVEHEGDWIECVYTREDLAQECAGYLLSERKPYQTDLTYRVEAWEAWSV